MKDWIDKAYELALQTQKRSYSPYSKFAVASVIKFAGSDTLLSGCNVENASYGLTVCAERIAIFKGISEIGAKKLEGVVVLTHAKPASPPCGACLQVIREFATDSTEIVLANTSGERKSYRLKDLLPVSFGPEDLK